MGKNQCLIFVYNLRFLQKKRLLHRNTGNNRGKETREVRALIRGCKKRMIFVPGNENSDFEAAYFILRRDAPETSGDDDIIKEANLIIERTLPASRRRERRKEKIRRILLSLALFASGAAAGALPLLLILFAR